MAQFHITVHNLSTEPIECSMTVFTNSHDGSDGWFPIAPGAVEVWRRSGWELVAFRNPAAAGTRVGSYLRMDHDMDVNFVVPFGQITHT